MTSLSAVVTILEFQMNDPFFSQLYNETLQLLLVTSSFLLLATTALPSDSHCISTSAEEEVEMEDDGK